MSASTVLADSELTEMVLDMNALQGEFLADKIVRGEGSRMDMYKLRLMVIDQQSLRWRWRDELENEGKRVKLAEDSDRSEQSFAKGVRITNRAADVISVWMYGEIGARYGGVSDVEFQEKFEQIPSDAHVALRIRSDGGDFITALAMREVIVSRLGKTVAYIDGLAASAATLVACACSKVVMGVGAKWMIHEASATMSGRVNDFEFAADQLRETNAAIEQIYSERWKGTRAELREALQKETWYDAAGAVEAGFADEVSQKLSAAAKLTRDFGYKSIPSELQIAAKATDFPKRMACELKLHRLARIY